MAFSAFDDKANEPTPDDLKRMLDRVSTHWDNLIGHCESEFAPLHKSWNFAGPKWGWSLRLRTRKRTVLYMTPCKAHFIVGFALGEKAVAVAHESALSESALEIIEGAPKYAEGRGVRIPVRKKSDVEDVKKIAAAKMST